MQRLAASIAAAFGLQAAEVGVANANAAQVQGQIRLLPRIQRCFQLHAAQAGVAEGQALARQRQLPLRRLQRTGQCQLALQLPLQPGPELTETRQRQFQLTAQALIQHALAAHPVVTETHQQALQLPLLPCSGALYLQLRRLAAQAPVEVDIGLRLQRAGVETTGGVQRTAQVAGHFGQPVTGVELAELEHGLPVDALGEAQPEHALRAALAGHQLQLRQADLAEVATDRAAQAEVPRRPLQLRGEVAQITAFAIADLRLQGAHSHRRRFVQRVKALPGEIQPVQLGIDAEGFAPG